VTRADGDTLLNKLLKFYGSATPRDRDQYVEEIRRCIVLLIEHGCDPNQVLELSLCCMMNDDDTMSEITRSVLVLRLS